MEIIHNPHDKLFERVLSVRKNAVSLLRNILPETLQKHLAIEEIYFEKDSFIPNNLKNYYSDLLASVPVLDKDYEARVYFLFEHKSTNFSNTPLQLLRYMLEIWDQYGKFLEYLVKVFESIKKIEPESEFMDFLVTVMHYLYSVRGEEEYLEIEKIADKQLSERGKYMGTIAEMLERRGEKRGILIGEQRGELRGELRGKQQGKLEAAQEMLIKALKLKFDFVKPRIIDQIKSVQSLDVLENLFELSFKCSAIEEFNKYLNQVTED